MTKTELKLDEQLGSEQDWFNRRTKRIWQRHLLYAPKWTVQAGEFLCQTYGAIPCDSYLEIGVAEGHSMEWILQNLKPRYAVGVDPYQGDKKHPQAKFDRYKHNAQERLKPWIQSGELDLQFIPSHQFFCQQVSGDRGEPDLYDLIYIDGSHDGHDCLLDMLLAYNLLTSSIRSENIGATTRDGSTDVLTTVGGMLIVDDLNRWFHFGRPLVRIAVHCFEQVMHGRMKKVWEDGRQCAFVKISG